MPLACKSFFWKKIPCHVVNLDNMQLFEVTIVKNSRRKAFISLEEANEFRMYILDREWGSITELSKKKVGKSPS